MEQEQKTIHKNKKEKRDKQFFFRIMNKKQSRRGNSYQIKLLTWSHHHLNTHSNWICEKGQQGQETITHRRRKGRGSADKRHTFFLPDVRSFTKSPFETHGPGSGGLSVFFIIPLSPPQSVRFSRLDTNSNEEARNNQEGKQFLGVHLAFWSCEADKNKSSSKLAEQEANEPHIARQAGINAPQDDHPSCCYCFPFVQSLLHHRIAYLFNEILMTETQDVGYLIGSRRKSKDERRFETVHFNLVNYLLSATVTVRFSFSPIKPPYHALINYVLWLRGSG